MQQIINILRFMLMLVWVIGLLGGVGTCIMAEQYPIAIAVAIMGCMAFPKVKEIYKSYFKD